MLELAGFNLLKANMATIKKKVANKADKKLSSKRVIVETSIFEDTQWRVSFGNLQRPKRSAGRPAKEVDHLFRVVGEKLPFSSLDDVKRHMVANKERMAGVYVAHDSMGCPRYIGRGAIFSRLAARKKAQSLELEYFSFYVVNEKKHEREIETLLIRAAAFLLEFNTRKKRVGIAAGSIHDFEVGTVFYQRQHKL